MLLNYLLEWLSWLLLFFSWAMLIRVALKRTGAAKDAGILQRKIYWTSMTTGILFFTFSVLFIADPITSFIVGMDYATPEQGPALFLILSAMLFLVLPFLTVPLIIRIFFKKNLR
jgi:hypothetical protein